MKSLRDATCAGFRDSAVLATLPFGARFDAEVMEFEMWRNAKRPERSFDWINWHLDLPRYTTSAERVGSLDPKKRAELVVLQKLLSGGIPRR